MPCALFAQHGCNASGVVEFACLLLSLTPAAAAAPQSTAADSTLATPH
jgi:hypothetical protein